MINSIPVLGWILSAFFSFGFSVPFWFFWSFSGLGQKYFYWLPPVYQSIPFLDCVGLFIVVSILRHTLTPRLADVTQKNENGKEAAS